MGLSNADDKRESEDENQKPKENGASMPLEEVKNSSEVECDWLIISLSYFLPEPELIFGWLLDNLDAGVLADGRTMHHALHCGRRRLPKPRDLGHHFWNCFLQLDFAVVFGLLLQLLPSASALMFCICVWSCCCFTTVAVLSFAFSVAPWARPSRSSAVLPSTSLNTMFVSESKTCVGFTTCLYGMLRINYIGPPKKTSPSGVLTLK